MVILYIYVAAIPATPSSRRRVKNVDKTEEDSKKVNETIFYNNKFDNLKDASAR